MTVDEMRKWIRGYCFEVGSCENCALDLPDSPIENECYAWASDAEVIQNYNWIKSHI